MRIFAALLLIALSTPAQAELEFVELSESDTNDVLQDFGATFVHTTVSGASSLGSMFGVEVGVIAGSYTASNISDISEDDVDSLPYAGISGILSIPYGIGAEISTIPEQSSDGTSFSNSSYAIHWNMMDAVNPDSVLGVRWRYYLGTVSFDFEQEVDSVDVDVEVESVHSGGDVTASLRLLGFLEPYVGIGVVNLDGKIEVSGEETIFDEGFTTSDDHSNKKSGNILFGGVVLDLTILHLGVEYASILNSPRIVGKAALALEF